MSMEAMAALRILSVQRGEAVVVPTMSAARGWATVSTLPELDLPVSGAMGIASSVALALALAQPNRQIIVLNGDGSLLTNLGSVITMPVCGPRTWSTPSAENEVYVFSQQSCPYGLAHPEAYADLMNAQASGKFPPTVRGQQLLDAMLCAPPPPPTLPAPAVSANDRYSTANGVKTGHSGRAHR
jgi:Thiamine pyrophosphate enzyme, C-terminal TPP binding domain